MNRLPQIRYVLLAMTLSLSSAIVLKADEAKSKPVTVSKILKVTHQIEIEESFPPNLYVKAIGEVPTGGYTNVKLERAIYVTPPKDGIQDYFLKAIPPSGPAITVISQVEAIDLWHGFPGWVKGIRMHGVKDGIVVIKFEPDQKPVRRRFTGGHVGDFAHPASFEKALQAAIKKLNEALYAGGVKDASVKWKVVKTSGQIGGIADLNQITVTIVAERQPAWPKKKQPQRIRQQKKPAVSK
ncbi:hypothetical protein [uncultured Gimesia sp.]|uniref:hypothetical protein n=1 Tax=uncultured Gimesia sp. TaxID=1678688 RepID=UPI0030DD7DB1|tara:strand:+ start:141737 stop:142456 length:720 start_codon:yes stop_codon:yes gene_type:complete